MSRHGCQLREICQRWPAPVQPERLRDRDVHRREGLSRGHRAARRLHPSRPRRGVVSARARSPTTGRGRGQTCAGCRRGARRDGELGGGRDRDAGCVVSERHRSPDHRGSAAPAATMDGQSALLREAQEGMARAAGLREREPEGPRWRHQLAGADAAVDRATIASRCGDELRTSRLRRQSPQHLLPARRVAARAGDHVRRALV